MEFGEEVERRLTLALASKRLKQVSLPVSQDRLALARLTWRKITHNALQSSYEAARERLTRMANDCRWSRRITGR